MISPLLLFLATMGPILAFAASALVFSGLRRWFAGR